MFPEAMLALARGVSVSRSFTTSASVSVRVYNAPKKFRPKEEKKEVKAKAPQGDLRGELAGYREERIVLSDDGAIIACWHPQVHFSARNSNLFTTVFIIPFPQPKFPYELSRPLPRSTENSTSSVMNTQVGPIISPRCRQWFSTLCFCFRSPKK